MWFLTVKICCWWCRLGKLELCIISETFTTPRARASAGVGRSQESFQRRRESPLGKLHSSMSELLFMCIATQGYDEVVVINSTVWYLFCLNCLSVSL